LWLSPALKQTKHISTVSYKKSIRSKIWHRDAWLWHCWLEDNATSNTAHSIFIMGPVHCNQPIKTWNMYCLYACVHNVLVNINENNNEYTHCISLQKLKTTNTQNKIIFNKIRESSEADLTRGVLALTASSTGSRTRGHWGLDVTCYNDHNTVCPNEKWTPKQTVVIQRKLAIFTWNFTRNNCKSSQAEWRISLEKKHDNINFIYMYYGITVAFVNCDLRWIWMDGQRWMEWMNGMEWMNTKWHQLENTSS